jgi:hypothetical protein
MRRPPRIALLIAVLAGVAVWVVFDLRSQPVATKAQATPGAPTAQASSESLFGIPARLGLATKGSDPFSTQSSPPAKLVAAGTSGTAGTAPPVVPMAPPLPYRFAGQFHRDSVMEIYLGHGEDIFPVKQGDTLEGQYKVEAVSSSEIAFVHLPSGIRQTLEFNALREPGTPQRAAAGDAKAPVSVAAFAPQAPALARSMGPAQLRWDGPANARAGASFDVALRVTSGEHIRSAPMQIRFDPKVLESVAVRPGRYFGNEKDAFGYRVNPEGSIFVGASSQTAAPAADAEFLVLTFKPIRPGAATEIKVDALNLQSVAGRVIAYNGVAAFRTTIAR